MTASYSVNDDNGNLAAIAPYGIATVTKDIEIPYKAIQCNADFDFYYGSVSGTTYTWRADTPMAIHPDMRLVTSTECLVF